MKCNTVVSIRKDLLSPEEKLLSDTEAAYTTLGVFIDALGRYEHVAGMPTLLHEMTQTHAELYARIAPEDDSDE